MSDPVPPIVDASGALTAIAERFDLGGPVRGIEPLGQGNVNDTYLVRLGEPARPAAVLQRVNTGVFSSPELVMANLVAFSDHVARRLLEPPRELEGRRWVVPRVFQARADGRPWVWEGSSFWRALGYVERAQSLERIGHSGHAREVGFGLGMFHRLISDLPADHLADTLEGFHITPSYLRQFDQVIAQLGTSPDPELSDCLTFVEQRRSLVPVLEQAKAAGILRERPIHGDPKINNVMLDLEGDQAVALVDLDTVKPGLVHYDIGDCLRSACNPLGEDIADWRAVHFDVSLCEALLSGYGSVASSFLTPADYDHIAVAIRLISFELGLRFLTDHLAGDLYFKTRYRGHNLLRARVQFRLTESIEEQEAAIEAVVAAIR
ncbi:aminoglycoside phosphotransferase family protein [Synechococcus sp. BA-124 BA4]|uniref:phosphotransferase enzyme family protein n=1 Tax=unclassified Synechococcus TaxID=2626047 RepID=UPI002AD51616|nr:MULTISPECIES: aminoglycoside phosphotransferase family protein [unclassified Synechococcus]MEA5399953.1 aminoglycoside phosphotransferase family protein [Synechococcus sp. BA-124 BA4]CAK6699072.1 N-acetylhexosamine 1-kinase [Synechococcus sp. CBW1107]